MKIKHLSEHNISYLGHCKRSIIFACKSLHAAVYFLVHAILPFVFETNGSEKIKELYEEVK